MCYVHVEELNNWSLVMWEKTEALLCASANIRFVQKLNVLSNGNAEHQMLGENCIPNAASLYADCQATCTSWCLVCIYSAMPIELHMPQKPCNPSNASLQFLFFSLMGRGGNGCMLACYFFSLTFNRSTHVHNTCIIYIYKVWSYLWIEHIVRQNQRRLKTHT